MVSHDERHPGVAVHPPAQAGDAGIAVEQRLRGEAPHGDDQLGLDQLDLAQQVRRALPYLLRLRVAIARRAAFQDVGDIHVLAALQADRGEHVVEQPPGLPDEGLAQPVFLGAGRLADQQPVGVLIADAQHGLLAGLVEAACSAGRHGSFQLDPEIARIFPLASQAPDRRQAHLGEHRVAPAHCRDSVSTSASSRPDGAG